MQAVVVKPLPHTGTKDRTPRTPRKTRRSMRAGWLDCDRLPQPSEEQGATEDENATEQTLARWRRLLHLEDGQPVEDGDALSVAQREAIMREYQALTADERFFLCMGLSAFMSSLMMDVTRCVRSIELGHQDDEVERTEDESSLVQVWGQLRKPGPGDEGQCAMLAQTFVAAMDRLSAVSRRAVAQAMGRMIFKPMGVNLPPNAQALEATLLVYGEGEQRTAAGSTCGGGSSDLTSPCRARTLTLRDRPRW